MAKTSLGGKLISFRVDPALQKQLEKHARDEQRKVADAVRRLVILALGVLDQRAAQVKR